MRRAGRLPFSLSRLPRHRHAARFLWTAFILLPTTLVCDVLDGYVARLDKKRQSVLGADLDSLADDPVPASARGAGIHARSTAAGHASSRISWCGVSRLARFNVTASRSRTKATGKVKYYFEGTPIPTSIVIVVMFGIAQYLGHVDDDLWFGSVKIGFALLHPLTLIYALSGSAMISATLRIPKP